MRTTHLVSLATALASVGGGAIACQLWPPLGQASYRRSSPPIEVSADCSFEHAGLQNEHAGGPANDLGNGRISQNLGSEYEVMVADCETKQAILLSSPTKVVNDVCGPTDVWLGPVSGPKGYLTLKEGETLEDLVRIAKARSVKVNVDAGSINIDPWGDVVRRREFVNLFCGCKLYYPDSPGAKK